MIYTAAIETPLGIHLAQSDGTAITKFTLPGEYERTECRLPVFELVSEYFRQYFEGGEPDITIPVDLSSVTPFCRDVLGIVARIPFGSVMTYGDIAAVLGEKRGHVVAAQAVGGAVKRNPAAMIIPCHRVVAKNGLGGYFGAEALKEKLLLFEKEHVLY